MTFQPQGFLVDRDALGDLIDLLEEADTNPGLLFCLQDAASNETLVSTCFMLEPAEMVALQTAPLDDVSLARMLKILADAHVRFMTARDDPAAAS